MPKNFLHEFAKSVSDNLPDGVKNAHAEIDHRIKEGIEKALANFKWVKLEDFELQQKILMKTREKLEALEKRVAALEARLPETESDEESESETAE